MRPCPRRLTYNASAVARLAYNLVRMAVGESVRQALEQWDRKVWDVAMLHACNALDGTSRKRYPALGVGTRFRTAIRDALDIFGVMAMPGVNLEQTRFPVAVRSDLLPERRPDIADVLFGMHRWLHGHSDQSSVQFEISPYVSANAALRIANNGTVQLPTSAVLGLLAVAVFAPENKGQVIPPQLSAHVVRPCFLHQRLVGLAGPLPRNGRLGQGAARHARLRRRMEHVDADRMTMMTAPDRRTAAVHALPSWPKGPSQR